MCFFGKYLGWVIRGGVNLDCVCKLCVCVFVLFGVVKVFCKFIIVVSSIVFVSNFFIFFFIGSN